MMHKTIGIIAVLLSMAFSASAQDDPNSALQAIRKNNKTIAAARKHLEARKLGNRTGISPDNPDLSADYLIGRPVSGGNQLDFSLSQRFDFPGSYRKMGELADRQDRLLELEMLEVEREVLWDAKQVILNLIYLNKRKSALEIRIVDARKVLADLTEKFNAGDLGALEVDKARIRLLGLENEMRKAEGKIASEAEHLSAMNGGVELSITDTTYPHAGNLPNANSIQQQVAENDPLLRWQGQNRLVQEQKIAVTRAMALPKLETGYHFQSVLGQTFNGVHFGATIPLWEHRNKVKAGEALAEFQVMERNARQAHLEHQTARLYTQYEQLRASVEAFEETLTRLNTRKILQLSLELGEIDFIRYATELDYYYQAFDQFLEIEHDYHHVIANLLKYQL